MAKVNEPRNISCSFCGLPQEKVKKIISNEILITFDELKNVIKK